MSEILWCRNRVNELEQQLQAADALAKFGQDLISCNIIGYCGKCRCDHRSEFEYALAAYEKVRGKIDKT